MTELRELPDPVLHLLESGVVAEFATVSAAGVPIDTPSFYFPSDDLKTIDLATGLINPTKAERARRNPKVGLLIEGAAEEPVIAIRGHAAVRDSDFEANAMRYISETGFRQVGPGLTWDEARTRVQYWTRIIIEVTPVQLLWWDDAASLDRPPHVWNAPADAALPPSDPAPAGRVTPGMWPAPPWREIARDALATGRVPHLAVCDGEGYPMPIRVTRFELAETGFRLEVPSGLPWALAGKASLSFEGHMIFIGEIVRESGAAAFRVERALPQNPASQSAKGALQLGEDISRTRQERLEQELKRRSKPIPQIPLEEPVPTRMARLRQARIASGAPITGMKPG